MGAEALSAVVAAITAKTADVSMTLRATVV
jgi:hypothetical protein